MAKLNEDVKLTDDQLEIARLKALLAEKEKQLQESSDTIVELAESRDFNYGNYNEKPTGKEVTVRVCSNPWERDEKKQKWVEVKSPTYYFTIELPKGAGLFLSTNGVEYYHGVQYEFTKEELVEVKARVANCWWHEKNVHGDNENMYRQKTNLIAS